MSSWPTSRRRPDTVELTRRDKSKVAARFLKVRGRKVLKLKDIAGVKIGLQSGDNGRFYRAAAGVNGGATKGGYKEVHLGQTVDRGSTRCDAASRGALTDLDSTIRATTAFMSRAHSTSEVQRGEFWR